MGKKKKIKSFYVTKKHISIPKSFIITSIIIVITLINCISIYYILSHMNPDDTNPVVTDKDIQDPQTLIIAAAQTTRESLSEVIAEYESANPEVSVKVIYGTPAELSDRLLQGEYFDLFFSSTEKHMDIFDENSDNFLCPNNKIDATTRTDILHNKCVLITSKSKEEAGNWDNFLALLYNSVKDISDNGTDSSDDSVQSETEWSEDDDYGTSESAEGIKTGSNPLVTLCIGNSDMPVGKYASVILSNLGLSEVDLLNQGVIVYKNSVIGIVESVKSGECDYGIVYSTDATAVQLDPLCVVDSTLTEIDVTYPIAVMANSTNKKKAASFIQYLNGKTSKNIFKKYGFSSVQ